MFKVAAPNLPTTTPAAKLAVNGGVHVGGDSDPGDDNLTVDGIVTVTGGQIVFPAAAVPSANANTLDDYQEGTWTPTVANMTEVGAATYSGGYTQIGDMVFFEIMIIPGTSTAATAGSTTITLPSTPGAVAVGSCADAAIVSLGNGVIYTDGKFYPPTWAANTNRVYISGSYRV